MESMWTLALKATLRHTCFASQRIRECLPHCEGSETLQLSGSVTTCPVTLTVRSEFEEELLTLPKDPV